MPRIAEADELEPVFPWESWAVELADSPTRALIFSYSDFGIMSPHHFRRKAKKAWAALDVTVTVRGEEVLVSLNA